MPSTGGILRLGVTQYPIHSTRPFAEGGIGVLLSSRPFNEESTPAVISSGRSFNIGLYGIFSSTRRFTIAGLLQLRSTRAFDIVEHVRTPLPGATTPPRGTHLPPETATALLLDASAVNADSVVVDDASGIFVGDVVRVGNEYRTVISVEPNP